MTRGEIARARAELATVVAAFFEETRRIRYAEVRLRQEPPWASVACGAAGIALAAWREAERTGAPAREARRWSSAALRARGGCNAPDLDRGDVARSVLYGPPGLRVVEVLATGAPAAAVAALRAAARGARHGPIEVAFGHAGLVDALRALHARTGDARIRAALDDAGGALRDRAEEELDGLPGLGFAHGRAGVLHALLAWSNSTGAPLPRSVFAALAALARKGLGRAPAGLERSWCNGAAGHALLWAKAYEVTRERGHLRLAREAARRARAARDADGGDLCCGLAGGAYACLALDRVEPNRGWHEAALALGARAAGCIRSAWPYGLLKGYAGIAYLAADLLDRRRPAAFPLVEG